MPNLSTKGTLMAGAFRLTSGVQWFSGSGAPVNGTTGKNQAQTGSFYVRTSNGAFYSNTGTKASPTWTLVGTFGALAQHHILVGNAGGVATDVAMSGDATIASTGAVTIAAGAVSPAKMSETGIQYAEVTISSADILAVGAGKFGHADGYPLVAGQVGKVLEFLSAAVIYDQGVKAYTDGGDTTVNYAGGVAVSNKVANSEFCAHNGDTVNCLKALAGATGLAMPVNTGLNLVTTAAFTDTGVGAVGVVRAKVAYRVHTTGL